MAETANLQPRRWRRRAGLVVAVAIFGWVALAIHPQPLFAYSAQRANLVLHARAPFPAQTGPLLDDVLARVSRSPLYDPHRTYDVFLCDTQALFRVFAPWNPRGGGGPQVY